MGGSFPQQKRKRMINAALRADFGLNYKSED